VAGWSRPVSESARGKADFSTSCVKEWGLPAAFQRAPAAKPLPGAEVWSACSRSALSSVSGVRSSWAASAEKSGGLREREFRGGRAFHSRRNSSGPAHPAPSLPGRRRLQIFQRLMTDASLIMRWTGRKAGAHATSQAREPRRNVSRRGGWRRGRRRVVDHIANASPMRCPTTIVQAMRGWPPSSAPNCPAS